MRKLIALALCVPLAGCPGEKPPMTNKDIVAEIDRCKRAGLKAQQLYQPLTSNGSAIVAIQCTQP